MPSRKNTHDLIPQKSDVLRYIAEMTQQLADMAERAGCESLGSDLRRAGLKALNSRDQTDP